MIHQLIPASVEMWARFEGEEPDVRVIALALVDGTAEALVEIEGELVLAPTTTGYVGCYAGRARPKNHHDPFNRIPKEPHAP